jgi:hypothetical protein
VLERTVGERARRNGGTTRIVDMLVEFTFTAPDLTSLVVVTAGEGADVADKATNKAMAGALKYAIMQTFMVPTREMNDGDGDTPDVPSQAESAANREAAQTLPPRDEIMSKLDEACEVLGQTRAKVTEKWRKANNVGPIAELDDSSKVPDLALYRFVVALQPYVDQARAQQQAGEPDQPAEQQSDEGIPPTDDEREAAHAAAHGVLCDATDGDRKCTGPAGHDGPHVWW